jgi:predicted small metal-binding protein
MAKVVYCNKVDPSSGCNHVIRGETEEEVLQKAGEHAKEHGIVEPTPELMARVRSSIEDEQSATRT